MAIQQQQLDELLQLGKQVARVLTPVASQPITVATGAGARRTTAWVFSDKQTGLTQYGNVIGLGKTQWQHMKTVDAWDIFANPQDTFNLVHIELTAMRNSL